MERLDAECYSTFGRVRLDGRDTVAHHRACAGDVSIRRRTANERQHGGAESDRLVDRATVVVNALATRGFSCRGKHSAPAKARYTEARIAHHPRRMLDTDFVKLVTPHPDRGDIVP